MSKCQQRLINELSFILWLESEMNIRIYTIYTVSIQYMYSIDNGCLCSLWGSPAEPSVTCDRGGVSCTSQQEKKMSLQAACREKRCNAERMSLRCWTLHHKDTQSKPEVN